MTIKQAFKEYMEGLGYQDIFLGAVPVNAPAKAFWIVSGGGSPIIKNNTGEKMKNYLLNVYYRNTDSQDVDQVLQDLEESVNSKACTQLNGYDTIELDGTGFQSDQDLDAEDRTVGLLQVTVTVYQSG